MVKSLVYKHSAAGFSTEILDYCQTSHTASPVTAGWGVLAQTGGLSSDDSVPVVRELEWSRCGWNNSCTNPSNNSQPIAAPETQLGSVPGSSLLPDCSNATDDVELVRCAANWAISSTGGNVGNGQTDLATIAGAGQSVDVRPGSIQTISSTGANLQVPLNQLFSIAGLGNLDPAKSTVVVSSTQHGGQAAMGLRMLGYTTIPGGYINGGIPRWNYAAGGELWAPTGNALPLASVSSWITPGLVDTTPPVVTSVTAENITKNSADIHRVAGEPATMKVEYGTTPGVYANAVNNTVLNADKIVTLSGLTPGTTYYYRVTTYDAYANPTVSPEGSFTTPCDSGRPAISISGHTARWASYSDYVNRIVTVDWTISNTGTNSAFNVMITGSTNSNGVTVDSGIPSAPVNIAPSASAAVSVRYHVPVNVGSWHTDMTGSAQDECGTSYTYP
jgi:hypothetical protein